MVSTFTTVALPACISILNGLPSNDEVAKADPSAMIMGEMNLNGHAFKYKVAAGAKGGVMHGAGGKTIKFTISGGMGHMKFMGHSINFPLHHGSAGGGGTVVHESTIHEGSLTLNGKTFKYKFNNGAK